MVYGLRSETVKMGLAFEREQANFYKYSIQDHDSLVFLCSRLCSHFPPNLICSLCLIDSVVEHYGHWVEKLHFMYDVASSLLSPGGLRMNRNI